MTEGKWLAAKNINTMLIWLRDKTSDRKLRLFGCLCCRRIWHLLDEQNRTLVEASERFADSRCTADDLLQVADWARVSTSATIGREVQYFAKLAARRTGDGSSAGYALQAAAAADPPSKEQQFQRAILHHVFGNPFRLYRAPPAWSGEIVQLAEVVYQGGDAGFALSDALLECGHPELAEHFRAEPACPKGCWVVDLITGRK